MAMLTMQEVQDAAVKYFPLARSLAAAQQRKLPPGINELDDLIGAASVGLMSALRRYDSSYGARLSSWVSIHIRGAIVDSLRSLDPLPQKWRELVKLVQEAQKDLEQWLRRKPTYTEIATLLGCSEQEVQEILQAGNISVVSIEEEGVSPPVDQQEDDKVMDPAREGEIVQKMEHLQECFKALLPREEKVLRMRFAGATYENIAAVFGVSTATSQRLGKSALSKIDQCMRNKGWQL
ncbi:MAG: sigma-70 family RNA polymerase sigma factor [Deltaproteobacteria bacterium]|nr:sigma-70 family RNA polymerase sigma factor [Deltaproteobacteria bacterium]